MKFHTPPQEQGQLVVRSYAAAGCHGVLLRVHNRTDRGTRYLFAKWTQRLADWWDEEGPWNSPPPKNGVRWMRLPEAKYRALVKDLEG